MAVGKKIFEVANLFENRYPDHGFTRLGIQQLAIDGFRELNLAASSSTSVEVVYLSVPSSGIVPMPDDYQDYIKVGVPAGGQMWTLTYNEKLLPPRAESECLYTYDEARSGTATPTTGFYFSPHETVNGESVGGLYGLGGGWNSQGYFKPDEKNRRFLLQGVAADQIVVEYKSNKLSKNTVVPEHCIEAIIAWLYWKTYEADPVAALSKIMYFEEKYNAQVIKIRDYENPFRIDEYLDMLGLDIHLAPKR